MITSIRLLLVVAISLFGIGVRVSADAPAPGLERFYIGTYSGAIYQSTLNLGT